MWLVRWVILWLLVPVVALASDLRPAETPPDDFVARQYIDSKGCVFLRDDAGWQPRLARDGTVICGYPPSLSARGAEGRPRLAALDPDAGKSRAQLVEEALTRAVVPNLQAGELRSDPRPLETLPDMGPEPAPTEPLDDLKAALRAAPAIRQGMSQDLKPNRRLCELLGYDGKPVPDGVGRDPSKGYCGALPENDLALLALARAVPMAKPADAAAPILAPIPAQPATRPPAPHQSAPRPPVGRKAHTPPATNAATGPGMIPPGARFVQVGTYANAENAQRAVQRVQRLGYPVMQGRDGQAQFIVAGPFESRESIVRALDGLRRGGFRDAYPR